MILTSPKISVIVCLYNTNSDLFINCLQGLRNQTFTDFEVIIVDDGSDKWVEQNYETIEELNDSRFKLYQKMHSGKSNTLNYALTLCSGKYIAINDSDDISYTNRLERQFNWLINNPEFDFISNAMLRKDDNCVMPASFLDSGEVNSDNIYYAANHPCCMFKIDVLNRIPFLFSQCYDATEDNVMNHIMFHYGIKMYYNNEILMNYANHANQVHWDNTHGFLKEVIYKLSFNTFNKEITNARTTCLLFLDDKWDIQEIEKTVLNIRLTSNNVKIVLADYIGNFNLKSICKYSVSVISNYANESFKDFLNRCIDNIETENLFFISTPIRFYDHNWDIYYEREIDRNEYTIYEPYLFDVQKIDTNNYLNENHKSTEANIQYGERLLMLQEDLTEQLEEFDVHTYSEYVYNSIIPIVSRQNIFVLRTHVFKHIVCSEAMNYCSLANMFNIVFSVLAYTIAGCYIHKKLDLKTGYVNFQFDKDFSYYIEYFAFTKLFFNETCYIHQKIINDKLNRDFETYIDPMTTNEIEPIKSETMSFSDYLKNINSKQPWIL